MSPQSNIALVVHLDSLVYLAKRRLTAPGKARVMQLRVMGPATSPDVWWPRRAYCNSRQCELLLCDYEQARLFTVSQSGAFFTISLRVKQTVVVESSELIWLVLHVLRQVSAGKIRHVYAWNNIHLFLVPLLAVLLLNRHFAGWLSAAVHWKNVGDASPVARVWPVKMRHYS